MMVQAARDALSRAEGNSPFLKGLIQKHPDLVSAIQSGDFDQALAQALASTDEDTGKMLRLRRQGVALVTAIADLAGVWDLTRVTQTLSAFADEALNIAINAAVQERYDVPTAGFTVIALGKHGGRELNYSSDIDPIFLFDPQKLPHRPNEDVAQAAVRIGKRVIELLNARDENGYVFRVDMRLRPSPEVSPVTLSVDGAIGYYESSALAWEQAAFIRSRHAAGDGDVAAYFLSSIENFIWRRSLDFGQLKNIQRMVAQIRSHYSKGQTFGPGYDLKRGRGGIRECEFFAQAHQLIHGGRDSGLRVADTRAALSALAAAGHIDADKADRLSNAYVMLRQWEHRLQMVDDRQTHHLPEDAEALDRLARLGGLTDGDALLHELQPHIDAVSAIFDELAEFEGEGDGPSLAEDGVPLFEQLTDIGFADPADPERRIKRWRSGRLRAIRSESAKEAFETVLPAIMLALAQAPDPSMALARFDNIIEKLPSAINFFHLLAARPALLQMLADILSYAPVLADALAQRIGLLDRFIEAGALELKIDANIMQRELEAAVRGLPYECQLDVIRDYVGEHRFTLGVQLIDGRQDVMEVAEGYSALAEAALRVSADAATAEFAGKHGLIEGGELLVLALGRLGGQALTHASDLDLVFLYRGRSDALSDGEKPLSATQYFNRLAQRVVAAMSVSTASGALYEVDTRLRPSGTQGPLCASLDGFAKYQQQEAWTWEHMALTRARPILGSDDANGLLSVVVKDTLGMRRDQAKLKEDVIQMRQDMALHKPVSGPLDLKLIPGGLVDLEFIVHYLQLKYAAGLHPQLSKAITALSDLGHLPADFLDSYNLLGRMLVMIRLIAPDCQEPPMPARHLVAKSLGQSDWASVLQEIETAKALVLSLWKRHLGGRDF